MKGQTIKKLNKLADGYALEFIKGVVAGHQGDVFMHPDTKDVLKLHYLAGAEGMRNAIWRNIEDEQPRKTDKILLLREGQVVMGVEPWLGAFTMPMGLGNKITPFHNGDKWCHIEDILPEEALQAMMDAKFKNKY